jgi:hypothetical protein
MSYLLLSKITVYFTGGTNYEAPNNAIPSLLVEVVRFPLDPNTHIHTHTRTHTYMYTHTRIYLRCGSVVGRATRLRAGWKGARIPIRASDFSLLQNVQAGSGVHPDPC